MQESGRKIIFNCNFVLRNPTGPSEWTPKPDYLIALAPYLGVLRGAANNLLQVSRGYNSCSGILVLVFIILIQFLPRTQMTFPVFLKVNPPKTRPFPMKTRVIWVLGIYMFFLHAIDGYPFLGGGQERWRPLQSSFWAKYLVVTPWVPLQLTISTDRLTRSKHDYAAYILEFQVENKKNGKLKTKKTTLGDKLNWWVVSTHLKNIRQIRSLPQGSGWKFKMFETTTQSTFPYHQRTFSSMLFEIPNPQLVKWHEGVIPTRRARKPVTKNANKAARKGSPDISNNQYLTFGTLWYNDEQKSFYLKFISPPIIQNLGLLFFFFYE